MSSLPSFAKMIYFWGVILLVFCAVILLSASSGFLINIPIGPWIIWVSVLLSFATSVYLVHTGSWYHALLNVSVLFLFWIIVAVPAGYILGRIYDLSWDGQWYHQEGIIRLAQGWNPLREFTASDVYSTELFLKSYAKGPWVLAAALYTCTGAIEYSKVFNFCLILASGAITFAAISTFPKIPLVTRISLAILTALNPVSIYQMLSFYIDGQLASLFVCVVGLLYLMLNMWDKSTVAGAIAAITLLCNTKVTAVAFIVVLLSGVGLWILSKHDFQLLKRLILMSTIAAATTTFSGINPYITNTIAHGNPLYPALGSTIDLMKDQRPGEFDTMWPPKRLFLSLFAQPGNIKAPNTVALKWPFQLGDDAKAYTSFDIRVAGFGPFFGGCLLLAGMGLVLLLTLRKPYSLNILTAMALLAMIVLINPEAWWARFAPQIWLAPLLVALGCLLARSRLLLAVSIALMLAMGSNLWFVGVQHFPDVLRRNDEMHAQLQQLAAANHVYNVNFHAFTSYRVRLAAAGIRFIEVKDLWCDDAIVLASTAKWGTIICPATSQVP